MNNQELNISEEDLRELKHAFQEILDTFREVFKDIADSLCQLIDNLVDSSEHYEHKSLTKSNWVIDYDTTKVSQVLSRKPKFTIRKMNM